MHSTALYLQYKEIHVIIVSIKTSLQNINSELGYSIKTVVELLLQKQMSLNFNFCSLIAVDES